MAYFNTENNEVKLTRYVDLTYLSSRTKANSELMAQMISFYLAQTPPLVIDLKQSFKDKNWELLDSTIHKMIPSFSIVGIDNEYQDMAKKIQEYAHTKQQLDGIEDLVLKIESVCTQACNELKEELKIIKGMVNS